MSRKPDDDRAWDDYLEQYELEGTDDARTLAEVEAALAAVGDVAPLTEERIAAAVELVETEEAPPYNVYALPRRLRWVKVAAAVLLATMLTAAVSVGVIWWERARAHETMSCAMAVKILVANDQDSLSNVAALTRAYECAVIAGKALEHALNSPGAPEEVLTLARIRRDDWIRAAVAGAGIGTSIPTEIERLSMLVEAAPTALERALALDRLVGAAITCIGAMHGHQPLDNETAQMRSHLVNKLRSHASRLR